jgi:hypothetical protein
MSEKITIIEGPPPTFEFIPSGWVTSIIETPTPVRVAVTRLRTYNGAKLVERCHRAWRHRETINLEFRSIEGIKSEVPIIACRYVEVEDGQVLYLWVRLPESAIDLDTGIDVEDEEDDEDLLDDFGPLDFNF